MIKDKKHQFAVLLSGCGVYDGSEIHEAVLTLLAIDKAGCSYQCFAPDIDQYHVKNHLTGKDSQETRNVLVESARIARGNIKSLSEFDVTLFDGLILPGGFGVAKNLSSLAIDGDKCTLNSEVEKVVFDMVEAGKPIGALCIAPAVLSKILKGATVTIGNDESTISVIEKMGGKHQIKGHGEVCIDSKFKLVTNPCYMLDASISQIEIGATNVVLAMLHLMK